MDLLNNYAISYVEETVWLSSLDIYPITLLELNLFIKQLDPLGFIKGIDIYRPERLIFLCDMDAERLDVFYLTLVVINKTVVEFCKETIKNYFIPEFHQYFVDYIESKISQLISPKSVRAFLEEFYCDMSFFIKFYLSRYLESPKIVPPMLDYITRLWKTDYYHCILRSLVFDEAIDVDNWFQSFPNSALRIIQQIYNYLVENLLEKIQDINYLADKVFDSHTPSQQLLTVIQKWHDCEMLTVQNMDAINSFDYLITSKLTAAQLRNYHELTIEIGDYPNFLFSKRHKKRMRKYAFWRSDDLSDNSPTEECFKTSKEVPETFLGDRGLEVVNTKSTTEGATDLLDIFVFLQLINSKEALVKMLIEFMEKERLSPGTYSKYSEIDLETCYLMTTDETDSSYDSILNYLKTHLELPPLCCLEFILRIISRILNINIDLYVDGKLKVIDNSGYYSLGTIIIYQLDLATFYLLRPKVLSHSSSYPTYHSKDDYELREYQTGGEVVEI